MAIDGSYSTDVTDNLIVVSNEELSTYWRQEPPAGKKLGTANGRPAWVDAPPQSKEKSVEFAQWYKDGLLSEARLIIDPLQDAIDLEMATDDEKATLLKWKKYRVLLGRVDTECAPNIEWPVAPQE
nr:tail fiber assembly protein [Yersinia pseudotuberculosis]